MFKRFLIGVVVVCLTWGGLVAAQTCLVQAYFVSPEIDGVIESAIIRALDGANQSLDIALASFTDDQLGSAVVRARLRGVTVRVILAAGQDTVLGSEYGKLVAADIPVVVVPDRHGFFNHSFAVVDRMLLITGSYGWSDAADQHNYENVLFIDCPVLTAAQTGVERYTSEFERLWQTLGEEAPTHPQSAVVTSGVSLILIDAVDRIGECLYLLNISSVDLDLAGWSISDLEGSYTFPDETIISPNEPYEVCIDTYNPAGDPGGLYLDDDSDEVYLVTPDGRIIDEVIW